MNLIKKSFPIFLSCFAANVVISGESEKAVISYDKAVVEPNPIVERFQLGFDTDARYDTNIDLAPDGFENEGMTYTFSPDLMYRILGDEFTEQMLAVSYGPTFYFDDVDHDFNVDHNADVAYTFRSGRTTASLVGRYSRVEGNNGRDLSKRGEALLLREQRRAASDRYGVDLNVDYAISSLLDAELRAGYSHASFDTLNDYSAYGADFALMYGGREAITRLGPYVGYERVEAQSHPSQDVYQAGARAEWNYSALTTIFGQVGVDSRDLEGAGTIDPDEEIVWAIGARWSPDEMLSAELAFDRTIAPSITSDGQNYAISTISLAIEKDIFSHYFLRTVGSYSWSEYEATLLGNGTAREDDYLSAYVEMGRMLSDYGKLSVFYNFLENDSNISTLSFDNHTVGLKLGVEF